MECAVCYGDNARCKLTCGHSFCHGCVKTWYQKGTGEGCPMCRAPIYFKGFYKIREKWADESYEVRTNEIFNGALNQAIEAELEQDREFKEAFGDEIQPDPLRMSDLSYIEDTYRYLKSEDMHHEDIDYILNETDDYYSTRGMNVKNQGREKPRSPPPPKSRRAFKPQPLRNRGQIGFR